MFTVHFAVFTHGIVIFVYIPLMLQRTNCVHRDSRVDSGSDYRIAKQGLIPLFLAEVKLLFKNLDDANDLSVILSLTNNSITP